MPDQADIKGSVVPGFEPIRAAFERNFTEYGDRGASVALYIDGRVKVDLWGGTADIESGRTWDRDTIALVYSVTKGATATLTSLLAQRRQLDLDAPVAQYWPEFAANGKGDVTVRMVLSHQAGLPAVTKALTRRDLVDLEPVTRALAAQAPLWTPGTAHGYHALTFGWLVGEIVRRATGRSVGQLFAAEIAAPLGLDFHIGLPASEEERVAPLVDAPPVDLSQIDTIDDPATKQFVRTMIAAMTDPSSLLSRALSINGALPTPDADSWNQRDIQATEQPAANGITNARSVARLYAACIGEVDGVRLLTEATLDDVTAEQSAGRDQVVMTPNRFASGYMLNSPGSVLLTNSSFGHLGAGGAIGFADRRHQVGFGYVQNQLGGGVRGDPRVAGLLAALKAVLDVE